MSLIFEQSNSSSISKQNVAIIEDTLNAFDNFKKQEKNVFSNNVF